MQDTICSDLTVLEIGDGKVAPAIAGMFLADNGARVVKVESTDGDALRQAAPSGWMVWNRGKESLAVDVGSNEGAAQLRELATKVDVVIDGLAPGQADELGLAYEELAASNPRLVYCSISSFGSSGPYRSIPAYDALVMAKNGSFARGDFGFRSGPIFNGALLASNGAAHQAVSGILAALVVRDRVGRGQRVDACLFQALNPNDYFFSYHVQIATRAAEGAAPAAAADEAPPDDTATVPAATRYMVLSCTLDGRWIAFSPQQPKQAAAMMQVLGLEQLLGHDRFKDMPAFWSIEDADAWEQAIHERVKEREAAEWIERSMANPDLPFEMVASAEEALDHPQVRANGNVVTVDVPGVGDVEQVGPVASFSVTPSVIERPAPRLGEHGPLEFEPSARSAPSPAMPAHPLAGLTIVEFGYYYAMPFGVTMAGALGARVIKVENLGGDPMRWSFGAPEWGAAKTMEGKESICLDAKTDKGREILHALVRDADVFIHGFRPGVEARLGVDYETLRTINPDLVYVHGAGYGTEGPYSQRPIYAGTVAAAAGSVHRQGAYWLDPELNRSLDAAEAQAVVAPRIRNLTDGDANAALAVMTAITFGLRHRVRTGQGQFIGTSMLGGNVLAYADDFNRYEGKPLTPQADSEQLGTSAVQRLYETADGWICLVIVTDAEWRAFTEAIGRSDLAGDERFASFARRAEHDAALAAELEPLFRSRPAADWERDLLEAGAGCVQVNELQQPMAVLADPVLQETGLVRPIEHPLFGALLRYGPPAEFSLTPARIAPGSVCGQHTAELLAELGYSGDDVKALVDERVVRVAE